MQSKVCLDCRKSKPHAEFYSNGLGRLASKCKTCFKAAVAERRQARRDAAGGGALDWVYVAYDEHDECLYVGRTSFPEKRLGDHKHGSPWWSQVARLRWQQFTDPEAAAIRSLEPKYNTLRAA